MNLRTLISTFALAGVALFSNLSAQESKVTPHLVSAAKPAKNSNECFKNQWKPYFLHVRNYQANKTSFFQGNVGIGVLYFSGVEGNTGLSNDSFGDNFETAKSATPVQGRLNYNRSPVYEWVSGYRFTNWLKLGLSFQAQSNLTVSSNWGIVTGNVSRSNTITSAQQKFSANLDLYGVTAKAYFNFPYALVVKMMAVDLFASAGIGPCWQTWRNIVISRQTVPNGVNKNAIENIPLEQKISASALFSSDFGFTTTWLVKSQSFILIKGLRFNLWGQARQMGLQRQQQFVNVRNFLKNPIKIKTVYQFAPYIGLQWNF